MKIPLTPVRCLLRAAELFGSTTGVVCGSKRFTYGEMAERCGRLASALARGGLGRGDRAAYLSYNTHQLLEGYYGAPMAYGIAMPLNVRLTQAELTDIIRHGEPKFLFYEAEFAAVAEQLLAAWPSMRTVNLDSEYEDFLAEGTGLCLSERLSIFFRTTRNRLRSCFIRAGARGTPKGVMLSHRTIYLHALGCKSSIDMDQYGVELHTIPLFHANGWGRPQTATMMGVKQVMVRRFDCPTVCGLIQGERATSMSIVPTMANALLAFEGRASFDLSSMREIMIGGAASTPLLIQRLSEAFPGANVMAGYGLTETCPVATSSRRKSTVVYAGDEDKFEWQSVAGWPIYGVEVRVVDTAMNDVPRDLSTVGEVAIRGDVVMDGYYREPEATAAVMSGGWFHSGDMAVWDVENYIHIVDRKKDIIISGGENISSIEVEKVIASYGGVAAAAVVSAPDARWGEVPVAFVVPRDGVSLDETELKNFSQCPACSV